jgi:hypothetical protein
MLDRWLKIPVLSRLGHVRRRLLQMAGNILSVWRRLCTRRRRRCSDGSNVDLDVSDRVPFDMVRVQAVTGAWKEDYSIS